MCNTRDVYEKRERERDCCSVSNSDDKKFLHNLILQPQCVFFGLESYRSVGVVKCPEMPLCF